MLAGERPEELADELEVLAPTLYRWKKQALIDDGRAPGLKSYEPDELARARRRIKDLETELELVEIVRPKRLGPVVRGLTDPLARRNYPCGPLGPSGGAAWKKCGAPSGTNLTSGTWSRKKATSAAAWRLLYVRVETSNQVTSSRRRAGSSTTTISWRHCGN
jgi:hypothetical protein